MRWCCGLILLMGLAAGAAGAQEARPALRVDLQAGDAAKRLHEGEAFGARLTVESGEAQRVVINIELCRAGGVARGAVVKANTIEAELASGQARTWEFEYAPGAGVYTIELVVRHAATNAVVHERKLDVRVFPRLTTRPTTQPLQVHNSGLSPFVVVHNRSPRTLLFQGMEKYGLGGPAHVALRDNHQSRVASTRGAIDPAGMSESWMLFWYGAAKGWDALRDIPYPMDVPMLVVLQKKPVAIGPAGGGVELTFEGESGYIAVVPLYGTTWVRAEQTAAWVKGLPEDVMQRCRMLAEISREYPIALHEQFRINPRADKLFIRDRFDFLSIDDEWATPHKKIAPLEFTVALAQRSKFRLLSVSGKVIDPDLPVGAGAFAGIEGDESGYTLTGLLRYVNMVEQPKTALADQARIEPGAAMAKAIDEKNLVFHFDASAGRMLITPNLIPQVYEVAVVDSGRRLIAEHWDVLCGMYNGHLRGVSWGSSGLVSGRGARLDARIATAVCFARMAWWAGDEDAYKLASFDTAKQLLALWTMGAAYPAWVREKNLWAAVAGAGEGGKVEDLWFSELRPANVGIAAGRGPIVGGEPQLRFMKDRMGDYAKRAGAERASEGGLKYVPLWQEGAPPRADNVYRTALTEQLPARSESPVFRVNSAEASAMLSWDWPVGPVVPPGEAPGLPLCGIAAGK